MWRTCLDTTDGAFREGQKATGKLKRPDLSKEVNGRYSSPPQNCLQGEE